MKIKDKKLFIEYFDKFIKEPQYDDELYIEQVYSFYENIDILKEIKLFIKLNNTLTVKTKKPKTKIKLKTNKKHKRKPLK